MDGIKEPDKGNLEGNYHALNMLTPNVDVAHWDKQNTIQYHTIRVYCENTISYNNGVLSQTEPKSGSVKVRRLIYRYSTNTIKLRVKKLDMEYSIIKIITIKS